MTWLLLAGFVPALVAAVAISVAMDRRARAVSASP
jgi:hypothetical protein